MAGIDELRKLKGYEPIFLPFLADVLIPNNETTKLQYEQINLVSQLTHNKQLTNIYSQESTIVNNLLENNIINLDEASE
jgi:hypothetical protein